MAYNSYGETYTAFSNLEKITRGNIELATREITEFMPLLLAEQDPARQGVLIRRFIGDLDKRYGAFLAHEAVNALRRRRIEVLGTAGASLPIDADRGTNLETRRAISEAFFEYDENGKISGIKDNADILMRETISNILRNRSRNTIRRSAGAAGNGFCRVPNLGACSFCMMLASRGAVYYSREKAGDIGAKYNRFHSHCHCTVTEVLERGDLPARVVEISQAAQQVQEEYERQGHKGAITYENIEIARARGLLEPLIS